MNPYAFFSPPTANVGADSGSGPVVPELVPVQAQDAVEVHLGKALPYHDVVLAHAAQHESRFDVHTYYPK